VEMIRMKRAVTDGINEKLSELTGGRQIGFSQNLSPV